MKHTENINDVQPQKPGRSSLPANIFISFLSLTIFIALLEISFRLLFPGSMMFYGIKFHNEDASFLLFQKDYVLDWALKPESRISFTGVSIETNSLGMRSPEPRGDPGMTVLFLGDSTTFGWGIRQDKIFPCLVKKELENKFPDQNISVLNASVPGYTSFHGRIIMQKLYSQHRPQWVVVCLSNNEYEISSTPLNDLYEKKKARFFMRLIFKSYFYQFLCDALNRTHHPQQTLKSCNTVKVPIDDYRQNIDAIVSQGIESSRVIVLEPPRNILYPPHTAGECLIKADSLKISYDGIREFQNKNYSKAVDIFRSAIQNDDENYLAYFWCGRSLLASRNIAGGIGLIELSVKKDPLSQIIPEEYIRFLSDYCRNPSDRLFYVSTREIFQEYRPEEIFLDRCHPTEKGHEIIASKISQIIEKHPVPR